MIEGGLVYVYAAYAVAGLALAGAALIVALRARYWAKAARKLNNIDPDPRGEPVIPDARNAIRNPGASVASVAPGVPGSASGGPGMTGE